MNFSWMFLSLGLGTAIVASGCGGQTMDGQDGGQGPNPNGDAALDATASGDVSLSDAAPPPFDGSAADSAGRPFQCGPEVCDSKTHFCCVLSVTAAPTCVANGSPCSGVQLTCTSAASCASGELCCFDLHADGGPAGGCQAQCQSGSGHYQLCASDSECPVGSRCEGAGVSLKACVPQQDAGSPPMDGGGPPPGDAGSDG